MAAEQGLATIGVEDTVAGRKRMVNRLDERAAEEREQSGFVAVDADADKRGSHLRRGWYWGEQLFAEKLLKLGEAAIGRKREARGYHKRCGAVLWVETLHGGESAAVRTRCRWLGEYSRSHFKPSRRRPCAKLPRPCGERRRKILAEKALTIVRSLSLWPQSGP